jgi:hypothetical protein
MQFNIQFDTSVPTSATAFRAAIASVANYYASTFTDNVTINLNVGLGEVGGNALPTGALAASQTNLALTSYKAVVGALKADALSSADHSAVASLPTRDPTGGGFYWVSTAEGKALGLYSGTGLDGSIGFSSTANFDYNTADGVTAGSYDFFGAAAHEISEVMGRVLLTGGRISIFNHSFTPLDLFHFSASHARIFSGTAAGYFSADNGVTNLQNFNTNPAGDSGDWSSAKGADAFNAFAATGQVEPVSSADLTALDVIGWNLSSTAHTTASTGAVNSGVHVANAAAATEASPTPTPADLYAEIRAALSVGHGLYSPHLATDLSYYYGV